MAKSQKGVETNSKAKPKKKEKIKYNWFFIILCAVILSFFIIIMLSEHFTLPFKVPSMDEVIEQFSQIVAQIKKMC